MEHPSKAIWGRGNAFGRKSDITFVEQQSRDHCATLARHHGAFLDAFFANLSLISLCNSQKTCCDRIDHQAVIAGNPDIKNSSHRSSISPFPRHSDPFSLYCHKFSLDQPLVFCGNSVNNFQTHWILRSTRSRTLYLFVSLRNYSAGLKKIAPQQLNYLDKHAQKLRELTKSVCRASQSHFSNVPLS